MNSSNNFYIGKSIENDSTFEACRVREEFVRNILHIWIKGSKIRLSREKVILSISTTDTGASVTGSRISIIERSKRTVEKFDTVLAMI